MPTYVLLANWTDQGIRGIKESPRRLDTAKKALKDMGGEFKAFYLQNKQARGAYGQARAAYDSTGRAGRRRRGAVQPAARHARQHPHPHHEGLPRGRLPGDHHLARLAGVILP